MNILIIFRIIIQFDTRRSFTELTLQYLVELELTSRSVLYSAFRQS